MQSTTQSSSWSLSDDNNIDNPAYELHWVRVGVNIFVASIIPSAKANNIQNGRLIGLYRTLYSRNSTRFSTSWYHYRRDLNQLSDQSLVERTGLFQIVYQPTRCGNILDCIFVSNPQLYCITSIVKTDHKAVFQTEGTAVSRLRAVFSSVIGADQRSTHSSYGTLQAWTSEILVQQPARIRPLIHRLSLIISIQQHSGFSTNFTQSILSR